MPAGRRYVLVEPSIVAFERARVGYLLTHDHELFSSTVDPATFARLEPRLRRLAEFDPRAGGSGAAFFEGSDAYYIPFHGLAGGIPRFRKHRGIFSGILKLAYVFAPLANAIANRAIRYGNYPIMGTMRMYVLSKLALVFRRRYDATVYPVLGGFEGYVEFEGKMAYCEPVHG